MDKFLLNHPSKADGERETTPMRAWGSMQNEKRENIIVDGSILRVGIVQARFNQEITDRLLDGAYAALRQSHVAKKNIVRETVPGSAELPFILEVLAKEGKYDALIALSCIIKGETYHYRHLAEFTARGILEVTLRYHIPIGFGILILYNKDQSLARSEQNEHNAGFQSAMAAVECAAKKNRHHV